MYANMYVTYTEFSLCKANKRVGLGVQAAVYLLESFHTTANFKIKLEVKYLFVFFFN